MKRTLLALFLVFAVALTFAGTAKADTIMFPYINSNPGNVSTVISIVNGTAALGSPTTGVGALHYRYITKQITSDADADLTSACSEQNFCRPTSPNDIVSFDTAGQLPDGRAMFGDPGAGFSTNPPFSQITYNSGGGNPPFFNDPNIPMPRRGYLLVTHATNPTSCVDICVQGELDGDAVLIDIVNAAAWGYKAVLNSTTGCAGTFTVAENYAFRSSDDRLMENGVSFFENTEIFPPSVWSTRYFVTPLFIHSDQCNGGNPEDDMRDIACQKRTRIGLVGNNPQLLTLGAYNRNESLQSGGQYVHVRCVAGINLLQLLGAGIVNSPAPFYTTGGWAIINLINPPPFSSGGLVTESITQGDYDAFVYDLKFGALTSLIASPAGNAMVNDGKIIRTRLESTAPRMTDTNP